MTALRFAAMDAKIVSTRTIPEGTYLAVRAGQIIDERPIKLPKRFVKPASITTSYVRDGKTITLSDARREVIKRRGTGGELAVIGTGSPSRSFKSELERSVDYVAKWDRLMRTEGQW